MSNQDPLRKIFNNSVLMEPFIRKIVFSNFKNIEPMQELHFDYPITALVGQNGTNKTSALVALYGSVDGKVPSEFWFTTPIDKTEGVQYQSYWYIYKDNYSKCNAEVFLHNNQKQNRNVDYWETDRPKSNYGMSPFKNVQSPNQTKTRWKKIKKDVVYINFRSELSAFDKCLYHSLKPSQNYKTKQDFIRAKSKNLKYSIDKNKDTFYLYNQQKIDKNVILSKSEVDLISKILNKKYSSIKYIEHSFFQTSGGTAFLQTESLYYSEAYAGSGEFAVVSLVHKVMNAPERSLILLDEPEVSLHPNAQKKLIEFLKNQSKEKKHQIVISTHSTEIIKELPDEAIKLFYEDSITKKVNINNSVNKYNVFTKLGYDYSKIPVYVEDRLAKKIIEYAIEDTGLKDTFSIEFFPGGAEAIIQRLNHYIEAGHKQIVLLDGDQKSELYKNNGDKFPLSQNVLDKDLDKTIEDLFNFPIKFFSDGSNRESNEIQKRELQRKFLDNVEKSVSFLPFETPEIFILIQDNISNIETTTLTSEQAKSKFCEITKKETGESDSNAILITQLRYLRMISKDDRHLQEIRNMLESIKNKI
ncbi:hypothetical protein BKK54_10380 [Rodentibacter genomosp. 1]|uniref:Endonuclease GajA/Old nuclease/RecF-like AAA domain-containing protein n=1 Tax=Rodentibacter genomosp. 1 TaxID=1908264 RepID=A0A1V3J159_9PAST|nr:AAA family ATPase [Rodentibacter genomosp. 1]OOF48710.1 hypothetical protein BKK54_10380 [Rodentibacter genomosp. 1]